MLINTTAARAGVGSISWVNENYENPRKPGFVFDKLPQLGECPGVVLPPLAFPNRDAISYSSKVFEGDTQTAVFGLRNNTLADYVIGVSGKPLLFARALLEESLRCLCIFRLKFGAKLGMALSKSVYLTTGVGLPIGVCSDILNTQINAKKFRNPAGRRLFYLTNLVKIKIPIPVNKVSFPSQVLKKLKMLIPGNKKDLDPAIYRPDRDGLLRQLPRKDALVIGDAAMPVEFPLRALVELVGISNLRQHPHYNLGCEVEPTPEVIIEKVVQIILAEYLCFPGMLADMVGSGIHYFQRLEKSLMLLFGGLKFNLGNQLHALIIAYRSSLDKKGDVAHSSVA